MNLSEDMEACCYLDFFFHLKKKKDLSYSLLFPLRNVEKFVQLKISCLALAAAGCGIYKYCSRHFLGNLVTIKQEQHSFAALVLQEEKVCCGVSVSNGAAASGAVSKQEGEVTLLVVSKYSSSEERLGSRPGTTYSVHYSLCSPVPPSIPRLGVQKYISTSAEHSSLPPAPSNPCSPCA